MNFKRLVKSRGFNVVTTLLVLGTIVWGVRNAAPRVEPKYVTAAAPETAKSPESEPTPASANNETSADAAKAEEKPDADGRSATEAAAGTEKAKAPDPAAGNGQAKPEQEKTAEVASSAGAPAAGMFQDARPVTAVDTSAASPNSGPSAASANPSTPDQRPSIADAASEQASRATAMAVARLSFNDPRPLTVPSFHDPRPVVAPSFRDLRPVLPTTMPAIAAQPGDMTTAGGRDGTSEPPKPFEMGWFLEDRNPVMRGKTPSEDVVTTRSAPAAPVSVRAPAAEPADRPAPAEPAGTAPTAEAAPPAVPARQPPVAVEQKIVVAAVPPAGEGTGSTRPADDASTLVAVSPPLLRLDAAECSAPEITTEAVDGGQMRIRVAAPCRKSEAVQISYGGAEIIRKLDAWGSLDYTLDCFAGTSSQVELRFADGSRQAFPVKANDLDKVSKVAVLWRAPVNLDLHVFEYGAGFDKPGHLWANATGSPGAARLKAQAERKGYGYLSSADREKTLGDKLEVYTFFHSDEQASGTIALALDYETRGEMPSGATCGRGGLAEIDFQVIILPRKGQATRQSGVLTRVDCGTRISQEARYNQSALPGLRIRK